jgi:hypothetical protein
MGDLLADGGVGYPHKVYRLVPETRKPGLFASIKFSLPGADAEGGENWLMIP